jgi:predicted N-acetyltransferase YhbS
VSSAVEVRPAQPADAEAIARMHRENAAYYHDLDPKAFRVPDEDGLVEFVTPTRDSNSETTLELIAEVNGEVAGHIEAQLLLPGENSRFQTVPYLATSRLWIASLGVFMRYWRRGVGGELVRAAEDWGRDRGAALVMCDTWIGSPVSVPFWESRLGYERRAVILQKEL